MRLAALLAALALALLPAAAAAQTPFQTLPPAQTTPTVTVAPPDPNQDGLQGWQQTALILSGVLLVVAIGWLIRQDARRRAPLKPGELAHPGVDAPKPNRSPEAKARARARAKAAKRQRRRNR
jgi:hypothetical protein